MHAAATQLHGRPALLAAAGAAPPLVLSPPASTRLRASSTKGTVSCTSSSLVMASSVCKGGRGGEGAGPVSVQATRHPAHAASSPQAHEGCMLPRRGGRPDPEFGWPCTASRLRQRPTASVQAAAALPRATAREPARLRQRDHVTQHGGALQQVALPRAAVPALRVVWLCGRESACKAGRAERLGAHALSSTDGGAPPGGPRHD